MVSNKEKVLLKFPKIKTGIERLDSLLRGGFEPGLVHVFGPPNSGKSNFAMQLVVNVLNYFPSSAPLWFDTNGNFDFNRLLELASMNEDLLQNFRLVQPESYDEFLFYIKKLNDYINMNTKIIVIDPITYFYTLMINKHNWFRLRHELSEIILGKLLGLTIFNQIIIILINQIRSKVNSNYKQEAVCYDIIERHSKYSIKFDNENTKTLEICKLRNVKVNIKFNFKIEKNNVS